MSDYLYWAKVRNITVSPQESYDCISLAPEPKRYVASFSGLVYPDAFYLEGVSVEGFSVTEAIDNLKLQLAKSGIQLRQD